MKNRAIICDIDGVLCDSSIRLSKYSDIAALERGDFNGYCASMHLYNISSYVDDVVISSGVDLLYSLRDFYKVDKIFFVTSRGGVGRPFTLDWLRSNLSFDILDSDLIMGPIQLEQEPGIFWKDGDFVFDSVIYKRESALRIMESYDVVMALDDHLPLCEMYSSLCIPSLHVLFPGVDCLTNSGMLQVPVVS